MCNMAAYAGKLPAAPILIEMLKNQEYLFGGYFTGIATADDNGIYMFKVIGTVDDLLKRYPEVLNMPGCVGIAHSRTPGFDGDRFAQPFLSGDEKVVYCANGISGIFPEQPYRKFYNKSRTNAVNYTTAISSDKGQPFIMDDGLSVHGSEIMSNAVASYHAGGNNLACSMHKAVVDLKAEIAALALSANEPDSVTALRINQPLMWGRDSDGNYLASSALAFKNNVSDISAVPVSSVVTMNSCDVTINPMPEFWDLFSPEEPVSEVYSKLDNMLAEETGYTVFELSKAVRDCWKNEQLAQHFHLVYEYLRERLKTGKTEFYDTQVPGSRKGLTTPERRFKQK